MVGVTREWEVTAQVEAPGLEGTGPYPEQWDVYGNDRSALLAGVHDWYVDNGYTVAALTIRLIRAVTGLTVVQAVEV